MLQYARSGGFIGPAGRDQTSGSPEPAGLPAGADDPAEVRRLWAVSEQLTGVPFDLEAGTAPSWF
ncbi:hypothetical protein [Streptomyces nitrosporeus]|uniref:hypothetical protein n=1 Tax=Streptomyces nitrosporeus TaxID=28894 RepID=UPI0019AB0ABE|nr:hypothetical protein [Streptomyces nitrosporeus]GGY80369.1 hypothetical protein GCM10010327_08690 [Streptomyces nitrosporeus]